jgi:predicted Rossmann fold nucleotide-binding protein DprA/Smf involved in DNA uptake
MAKMPNDPPSQRGHAELLAGEPIAFFCSQSCPGDVILKAQDWTNARGAVDAPVISGFHTPVERDVLRILLRGGRPIIYTLARAREGARLPAALRAAEEKGHALILSPFTAATRQTTVRTAEERNRHVLGRAASVLFAHASPGGKTEALAAEAIAMGLPVFTLPSPANANLVSMGAAVI